jgi:hypothetical protein
LLLLLLLLLLVSPPETHRVVTIDGYTNDVDRLFDFGRKQQDVVVVAKKRRCAGWNFPAEHSPARRTINK